MHSSGDLASREPLREPLLEEKPQERERDEGRLGGVGHLLLRRLLHLPAVVTGVAKSKRGSFGSLISPFPFSSFSLFLLLRSLERFLSLFESRK